MFLGNERGKSFAIDWNSTYSEADKYLKMVGLSESSRTLIKDMGVGKQQMVEIAKALAKNAGVLILFPPWGLGCPAWAMQGAGQGISKEPSLVLSSGAPGCSRVAPAGGIQD